MIRTSNKIFGEANASNTCITPNIMDKNKLIVVNSEGKLSVLEPKDENGNITAGIYYVDANDNAAFFPATKPNMLLGTDSNGNLTWINI